MPDVPPAVVAPGRGGAVRLVTFDLDDCVWDSVEVMTRAEEVHARRWGGPQLSHASAAADRRLVAAQCNRSTRLAQLGRSVAGAWARRRGRPRWPRRTRG
jgi:hypothetical protein